MMVWVICLSKLHSFTFLLSFNKAAQDLLQEKNENIADLLHT